MCDILLATMIDSRTNRCGEGNPGIRIVASKMSHMHIFEFYKLGSILLSNNIELFSWKVWIYDLIRKAKWI